MDILHTTRLWLRTWDAADLERAYSLWSDAAVMAFLGGILSREKIQEKLKFEMACQEKSGVQYWPIFEKQTDEFVGCCGLRPWVYSAPEGHELGFHLLKTKWRHGYAFEAAQAVVRHRFEKLQLRMLRAGHHPDHVNSKKILLKLEFQFGRGVLQAYGIDASHVQIGEGEQIVATVHLNFRARQVM